MSGDEERLLMDEEAYIDQHLTSYPAWKAWPVRVNGLPLSMTTKDLEKTFYDVSICTYLRFLYHCHHASPAGFSSGS